MNLVLRASHAVATCKFPTGLKVASMDFNSCQSGKEYFPFMLQPLIQRYRNQRNDLNLVSSENVSRTALPLSSSEN